MKRLFIMLTVFVPMMLLTGCIETQKGEKIGMITKVAQEGLFCPTWEAQVIRGGFNQGSGASGTAFEFTIESDELAKKVTKLAEERKEVKITYRKEAVTICSSDSNNYFLVSIEELKHDEQGKGNVIKPVASAPNMQVPATNVTAQDREKIIRLLQVQAELITELAKDVK